MIKLKTLLIQSIVDSPEFKSWFGNSKVVDKNGNPLVVYHGTRYSFDTFDIEKTGKHDPGYFGKGFYFTSNQKAAFCYSGNSSCDYDEDSVVVAAFLSIKNPFINTPNKTLSDIVGTDIKNKGGIEITNTLKKLI